MRIARILGIPVEVHYTWLFVFAFVAWSLAAGYFPQVAPGLRPPALFALAVEAALVFFASLLLHKLAHAYVATRSGLAMRGITLFIPQPMSWSPCSTLSRHFLWTAGVSSARPLAQADVVTLAQCLEGLSQLLTVRNRFEEAATALARGKAMSQEEAIALALGIARS